jgi:hypothetical protein
MLYVKPSELIMDMFRKKELITHIFLSLYKQNEIGTNYSSYTRLKRTYYLTPYKEIQYIGTNSAIHLQINYT